MYKIKQVPEDFIVEEVSSIVPSNVGSYKYFVLKKRNYTTLDAIQKIADLLRLDIKHFGFAGNKDKVAVTKQLISVTGISKDKVENIKLRDIELRFVGLGESPICLGDLIGNKFTITVRNIDTGPKIIERFPNFFGEQRFSTNNVEIGKALIKRDFKHSVELIVKGKGRFEEKVRRYIRDKRSDYIGALRKIPKKVLKMYMHAYQSFLWNKIAEEYISSYNGINVKLPIPGFGTEVDDKNVKEVLYRILNLEKIDLRNFILKEIPELSAEGGERELYVKIKDFFVTTLEDDEFNRGKKKCVVKFFLPKGSYATVAIKYMFENS